MICSYVYIIYRILQTDFEFTSFSISKNKLLYLPIVFFLGALNISTESLKWKVLLSSFQKVSFIQSLKMVFAGFSSGIFTPAKLGEPIGRIITLSKQYWSKATTLNYFGGFLQNIVIFVVGTAFTLLATSTKEFKHLSLLYYSLSIIVFSSLILYILYVSRNKISKYITKYKVINILSEPILEIKKIQLRKYILLLFLSISRYLIYCFQLIILIYIITDSQFQLNIIILIPIYFMCITIIPSFILADLGVRNSVALFLFSSHFGHESFIMLSVSSLWIINQAIPALFGTFFILKKGK